jgi:hypothetical protein
VRRLLFLVCFALLVWPAPGHAQKTAAAAAATTIVKTSAGAMLAVAQALVDATWNPLLDNRVQESPAAAALGAAWKPSDPRWQKARQALGARMTLVMESYAKSNQIAGHVGAEIGRIGAGPDLDAAIAALTGPAGEALVRQNAKREFIVTAMTASPNGPAIGSPEWNKQLGELGQAFEARVGPRLPPDNGAHAAELQTLANGPVASLLTRVWMFAVSNAQRQMNTALNLMVFDEQAAIERDVASAIGAGPATARQAADSSKDAFSLEKMAVCQDSWLDWGDDQARAGTFRDGFRAQFKEGGKNGEYFVPKSHAALMGLPVSRVYASTIGMARGFSVLVDAPFDAVKKNVEKVIGKTLKKCETGEGMHTCELEIAEKRTVMMMGDATGKDKSTLVGCFYFYEK